MYGGNAPAAITGAWVYRSYLNRPDVIVGGDPAKALSLLFGEGVMTFDVNPEGALKGNLDMGGNMVLDLAGTVSAPAGPEPVLLRIAGIGRPGTPTDGWEYDYVGYLAETWPNGIDQIPAVAGTVIRAKPHGGGKAGVTASFSAVKKP
jgi:hypothetical protein